MAIDPNHVNASYNKGIALRELGLYNESIVFIDKVLAINPNNVGALSLKGLALYNLGQYQEAIGYFDKVLAIEPNNDLALTNKQKASDNLEADGTTETPSDEVTTGSVGAPQPQQKITCGSVVTGTVTLGENITCSGDGLIVGDDATTINLNGFGIYGPGADSSKIGIGISEDNVAIKGPGIIESGFQAGILATGATRLNIASTILQNNEIGVTSD